MQFVCPSDKAPLTDFHCVACGTSYPQVDGVPILLNEKNSVFRIADYTRQAGYKGASGYGGSLDKSNPLKKAYRKFARSMSQAPIPGYSFDPVKRILAENPGAKVLVIGAGEKVRYAGDVVYTDVAPAANIACVCDAHDIPFPDGTFDAVVAQAVLEHVCDPQRCVEEMTRVLKPDGMIAAVTPFLQPVHMGAHDFTRFTYLGHRRLFRFFDEVESGKSGGAGYTAVHLIREMMVTVSDNKRVQGFMRLLSLVITHPLRYLDLLYKSEASFNAACAFYFLGRRRRDAIPDRDILKAFRGR